VSSAIAKKIAAGAGGQPSTAQVKLKGMKKETKKKNPHAVALGRLGGLKGGNARAEALTDAELSAIGRMGGRAGGPARAAALTPAKRKAIAKKAAAARWANKAEPNAE